MGEEILPSQHRQWYLRDFLGGEGLEERGDLKKFAKMMGLDFEDVVD